MYRALVIGCGNIGAMYDFANEQVLTHAKALSLDPAFSLSVFDSNDGQAQKIAAKYKADVVTTIDADTLKAFDCVSICTPTDTHFTYLSQCFDAKVPVVICEKPVSNQPAELEQSLTAYQQSSSKVIVNYVRRFQPAYHELKNTIGKLLEKEKLTNVAIRYQRGFINNCSHAFDLIGFLCNKPVELTGIQYHHAVNDHFPHDPTVSMQAMWQDTNMNILGLADVKFSHFEIDLYLESHKISLKEAGQLIEIYAAGYSDAFLQPLKLQQQYTHCLKDYMIPVIAQAQRLLKGETTEDNLAEAIRMNQRMLTYIQN